MAEKKFTVYRTQHGPVVRQQDGKWVSFRIMQEPVKALEQSFLRTKAKDYKSYKKTLELFANSSNNTVFASAQGDIAYFHGNYTRGATLASTGPSRSTGAILQPNTRGYSK